MAVDETEGRMGNGESGMAKGECEEGEGRIANGEWGETEGGVARSRGWVGQDRL